ncbi:Nicotinate-nucleotide--dimethylbenzimidazole phosphoribosyltransferase [bioreactor metagenome]|uniref:Nicotinate-nucleotide--dimethylbenzimidazole phosphoribosyltransferase n=1 Tax=bioreactor metagenome TaxID=1076179 RepID=A0A644YI19_9ZZZZ
MIDILELISNIEPLDRMAIHEARYHFDNLIKPKGSLAKLEDMVCLYIGATGEADPVKLTYPKKVISLWASEQDKPFLEKMYSGKEPLNFLAEQAKSEVLITELICQKIDSSAESMIDALLTGVDNTEKNIKSNGYQLFSVAVPGRYTLPVEWNDIKKEDPYIILQHFGDVRLAAAVGAILTSSFLRTPVMLDGLASVVAAFLAAKIAPISLEYCIASNITTEEGQEDLIEELGLSAVLRLQISQGQGEGSALAFTLFDGGIKAYKEMETFAQAGVHTEVEEFSILKK